MTSPQPITDVVFDFCGVLIDWQCRAALDGHYPAELVDRIAADDDPYGFFRYEDDMDSGMDFADVYPRVVAEQGQDIARIFEYYIAHYGDALPRLIPGAEDLLRDLTQGGVRVWGLTNCASRTATSTSSHRLASGLTPRARCSSTTPRRTSKEPQTRAGMRAASPTHNRRAATSPRSACSWANTDRQLTAEQGKTPWRHYCSSNTS